MARLRTRKHRVVLNRSAGGDVSISIFLILVGAFMFLPMLYAILQSLKPLDELWVFPPKFWVEDPTINNYLDLFRLMNTSWVPFSSGHFGVGNFWQPDFGFHGGVCAFENAFSRQESHV